jgi:glycosyltransferase involved in cell wall biosynthesis
VILGGVDAAALPEINYGIWLSPWKSRLLRHGMRNANLILVVAPFMKDKIKQFARYEGHNIEYLPTGYNTDFWKPEGASREKCVLTVSHSDTETRLKTKGLDYLCQAAEKMPETRFVIIGIERTLFLSVGVHIPPNMETLTGMPQKELRRYYQRCKVFCQPSRSEGMPNTLCEAMACGCIPVGTDVNGILTAIGDTGFVAPLGDIDALTAALQKALDSDESLGMQARQRIIEQFPLDRRVEGIRKAILGTKWD